MFKITVLVIIFFIIYSSIIIVLEYQKLNEEMEAKKREIQQILTELRAGSEFAPYLVSLLKKILFELGLTPEQIGSSEKEIRGFLQNCKKRNNGKMMKMYNI